MSGDPLIEGGGLLNECPLVGVCGGCSFKGVPYADQLLEKRFRLSSLLMMPEDRIALFSGPPLRYRNRLDLVFFPSGSHEGFSLGFRKKGSWDSFVPVSDCFIGSEDVNGLVKEFLSFADSLAREDSSLIVPFVQGGIKNRDGGSVGSSRGGVGLFKYLVARHTGADSSLSFVLNKDSPLFDRGVALIKRFAESSSANNLLVVRSDPNKDLSVGSDLLVIKGSSFLKARVAGSLFEFNSQGFFQNNLLVAEKMVLHVKNSLSSLLGSRASSSLLLDLYGGAGLFGIVLAPLFERTFLAEIDEGSVIAARNNARLNNISSFEPFLLDANNLSLLVDRLVPSKDGELVVVVDPPRAGLGSKVISVLNSLSPKVLVYVSCNPSQLAKDLSRLKGYSVSSVGLFDLFPQTTHFEAVLILVRD